MWVKGKLCLNSLPLRSLDTNKKKKTPRPRTMKISFPKLDPTLVHVLAFSNYYFSELLFSFVIINC